MSLSAAKEGVTNRSRSVSSGSVGDGLIAAARRCDEFLLGLRANEAVPFTMNIIGRGVRPAVGAADLAIRGARGKSYVMNPGSIFTEGNGAGWGDSELEAFLDEWSASRGWSNQASPFWQDGGPYIDLFTLMIAVAGELFPAPKGESSYFNLVDRWTFNITLSAQGVDVLRGISRDISWDELAVVADTRFPKRSAGWLDCFGLLLNNGYLQYPARSWSGAFGVSEILAPALEFCGGGVIELFTGIYEGSAELVTFEEIAEVVVTLAQ